MKAVKKATYRNRANGRPFFAVINLGTTHESSIHKWIPVDKLKHDPKKVRVPAYLPPTPEVRHDRAQYDDKIEQMDAQVGGILDQLKKDGVAGNTIIFYYGDHGGVLPRSKRFVYESGLHIPLIIYFPKKYQYLAPGKPGTHTDRLVCEVDLAATMLSLTGIKIPGYMQRHAFLGSHVHDAGFMPEAMMENRAQKGHTTIYQYVRSNAYPQEKIISMAEMASMENPENLPKLISGLKDADPAVRYWATYGCAMLKHKAMPAKQALNYLLNDPSPDVAIAASEALYYLDEIPQSPNRLKKVLDNEHDKVRLHALNVIRTLGKDALPLLPKLKSMIQHPKPVKGETYGLRLIKNIIKHLARENTR